MKFQDIDNGNIFKFRFLIKISGYFWYYKLGIRNSISTIVVADEGYNVLFLVKIALNISELPICRNIQPEVFYKKGFHKSFAEFTGKHLCLKLFKIN